MGILVFSKLGQRSRPIGQNIWYHQIPSLSKVMPMCNITAICQRVKKLLAICFCRRWTHIPNTFFFKSRSKAKLKRSQHLVPSKRHCHNQCSYETLKLYAKELKNYCQMFLPLIDRAKSSLQGEGVV